MKSLAHVLEADLLAAIRERGGSIRSAPSGPDAARADAHIEWEGVRYVVELKASAENRVEALKGRLATAALEAQRAARASDARPVAVVGLERLTDRVLAALSSYAAEILVGVDWGVIDRQGRRHFAAAPWSALNREAIHRPRASAESKPVLDFFSDRGQWLSKILLAQRLPETLIAAPRGSLPNTLRLAQLAEVSAPSVSRWAQRLRREGFLESEGDALRLVRREELFERWRRALARPRREVRARWLLPTGDNDANLAHVLSVYCNDAVAAFDPDGPASYAGRVAWKASPRACLGLFSASTALGFSFVRGAPSHLYLESIDDEVLRRFGLQPAKGAEQADVTVVEPRCPESTFRACVMARGPHRVAVPVSDVLQTWLEIAAHPARGREQAEEIERDVLRRWILDS